MSRVARIVPSEVYRIVGDYTLTNESNMFTNTDSTTFATAYTSGTGVSSVGVYVSGFDFSAIPQSGVLTYSIKFKSRNTKGSTASSTKIIYDGDTAVANQKTLSYTLATYDRINSIENPLDWSDLVAIGDNLNIRIPLQELNSYNYIYGIEIEVTYEVPTNKVVYDGKVLIDLTADTITAADLAQGVTAHDASGASITGTLDKASGSVYQDADGYLVVDDSESSAPQGNLSITANGTYDVADYAGASVDVGDYTHHILDNNNHLWVRVVDMNDNVVGIASQDTSRYSIDWGDGTTEATTPDSNKVYLHEYAKTGLYHVITPKKLYLRNLGSNAGLPYSHFIEAAEVYKLTASDTFNKLPCLKYVYMSDLDNSTNIDGQYDLYGGFSDCYSLQYVRMNPNSTVISGSQFDGCLNLIKIDGIDSITHIFDQAFRNCSKYKLSHLPESLVEIGKYAFYGCKLMDFDQLPAGVTAIKDNTFYGCSSIKTLDCLGAVESIAAYAFYNCAALTTLVLRKTDGACTLADTYAFNNTPLRGYNSLTGTVYVPQALISTYQTATNWSELYNAGTVTFAAIEGSEYER